MKAIFSGDLHLGRRSSRVPPAVDGRQSSAAGAWERMVDTAIANQADIVLLSGDIVDQDNRFYEAIGPLERGLARLRAAGIRTLAVAGNHDFQVLARLARNLDGQSFTLLGAEGRWQREIIHVDGRPGVAIDGWSFPRQHVEESPLESYRPSSDGEIPTLVMVHGELDNPTSPYAPLDRRRMLSTPVAGWLIGHVHAPCDIHEPGRPFILNPGSPQALDPGETGVHGPWLIEVSAGRPPSYRQLPLSTVRYEDVPVVLEDAPDRSAADARVVSAIHEALAAITRSSGPALLHLAIRLTIGGTAAPPLMTELAKLTEDLRRPENDLGSSQCSVSLEEIALDVRPTIDLGALARERNAAAEIARLSLALDAGGPLPPEYATLVDEAVRRMREVHAHRDFHALADTGVPTQADARRVLRREASELIAALLAGGEPE